MQFRDGPAAVTELGERSGTRMIFSTSLPTAAPAYAKSSLARGVASRLVRPGPARGLHAASAAWKAHVPLAWVVSLSVHSVVLAALGWSLPSRPVTRWIAVSPGQASIALLASPAAELVVVEPEPPLSEFHQPAEEPHRATPIEIARLVETIVRQESPQTPLLDQAEFAPAEPPPEHPRVDLAMVPSRRGLAEAMPHVPSETDSSTPRTHDASRQAELPPSTADAQPSVASLDSQGAQDQAPAILQNPAPGYPAAALQARQTGRVVLLVGVHPDGSVAWARLFQSSGVSSLDQAALDVIHRWRFSPAEGATTVRPIRVPFRFVMDE